MEQGEFRAGEALSKGFAIWFKNLPAFVVLSALVYSPLIVYTVVIISGEMSTEAFQKWSWVTGLLGFPLSLVATAAVLYGTIEQLRGRHAGIGESIGIGIKRLLPVLGVGFLSGLAIVAGMFLLVIPGIIVACVLYVATPAAVIERPGVFGALRRSSELTKGSRWPIFGIGALLIALNLIIGYMLQKSLVSLPAELADLKKYIWLELGKSIVLASLNATINGVVYHDLRVAKEGVQTEDLARVFE